MTETALEKRSSNALQNLAIGRTINGKHLITLDDKMLKSRWSAFVNKHSDLKISITSVRIIERKGVLFLEGKDSKNQASSLIALTTNHGVIYEARVEGGGCTVTCSGCESTGQGSAGECEPKIENGKSYCTSCSAGTCKKSVSCDQRSVLSAEWELELDMIID